MIDCTAYAHRTVAVFGLARSGRAVARALLAGGAKVLAWDDGAAARDASGLAVTDLDTADWSSIAALILSPGVPLTHPAPHRLVARAKAAGVPVLGDVELFLGARPTGTKVVGITGTNGKSTTTALTGHLLQAANVPVAIGGNIGTAVFDLPALPAGGVYVLEMSSFQIDLTPGWAADVGLLLNATPDHLDRHGAMEHYVAVKERLVAASTVKLVGVDDDWCRAIAARHRATTVSVGGTADYAVIDGRLAGIDLRDLPTLRGVHNWQNAAFAIAAVQALGLQLSVIAPALKTFPGLAHRMERVGQIGNVVFVNDSKATNADAAARALASYDAIYWIAGGKPKEGGIAGLDAWHKHIRHAYLIGVAASDFAATLAGKVPASIAGTLDVAVTSAHADAARGGEPGAVVLLSPACASYDQFKDFEQRGDAFRDLVRRLAAASPTGAAA